MTNEIKVTGRKLTFSADCIRLNPHLPAALGAVGQPKRQPHQRSQSQDSKLESVPGCLGYRVTIISCRRKLVDAHDNLRTGLKPLVDRITSSLGFSDDADPKLVWEYGQIETRGEQGTIVKITEL